MYTGKFEDRVRVRLDELSSRLGDANWLERAFGAGHLLIVTLLRRLSGSSELEKIFETSAPTSRVAKRGSPISVLSTRNWRCARPKSVTGLSASALGRERTIC